MEPTPEMIEKMKYAFQLFIEKQMPNLEEYESLDDQKEPEPKGHGTIIQTLSTSTEKQEQAHGDSNKTHDSNIDRIEKNIENKIDNINEQNTDQNCINDPVAMVEYGKKLLTGEKIEKNEIEAVRLFQQASELGYHDGILNYGICLKNGIGIRKDEIKGHQFIHDAAQKGNPEAQYLVASRLMEKKRTKQTINEALYYLELAARQKHPDATLKYSRYLESKGEIQQAETLLKDALVMTRPDLYFAMAKFLQRNDFTRKKEIENYLTIASDNGLVEATIELALLIESYGNGNKNEIEKLYQKAAEKGSQNGNAELSYSQFLLRNNNYLDYNEQSQINEKLETIFDYLKKAILKRNVDAMLEYAMTKDQIAQNLLKANKNSDNEINEALKYYKMAGMEGRVFGLFKYAEILRKYLKRFEEAAIWMKKAADAGHSTASSQYAEMLRKGEGVPKNEQEAQYYASLSQTNLMDKQSIKINY